MAQIILAGAGHCHVELVRRARDFHRAGHQLIVVSPEREHWYSGMAPGVLAESWSGTDATLPAGEIARRRGVPFHETAVQSCDPRRQVVYCSNGTAYRYDVLSLNLGSETLTHREAPRQLHHETAPDDLPAVHPPVIPVKPVRNLEAVLPRLDAVAAERRGEENVTVAVAGGGYAAVEVAANLAAARRFAISLHTRRFLPALMQYPRQRDYVRRALEHRGVVIHEGVAVVPGDLPADLVLMATGTVPPAVLRSMHLPLHHDGAVLTDRYLRVLQEERIFAVGDCARFTPAPLARAGVFAVRQQGVLLHNLLITASEAQETGAKSSRQPRRLRPFRQTGVYLQGVNLGPEDGMLFRRWWTLTGKPAWHLKYRIDRRFMRRYRTV